MIPRRPFGPLPAPVPVLGLGTWNMEKDDRASAVRALRRGLDLGLSHIDTAELYGGGEVERLVADAIDGRRDEVFLVSKVLPDNASRRGTLQACERSLKRLRTDRLDLYLLHWESSHPLEETIAAFEALVRGGKIRAWGVSNFDDRQLAETVRLAGENRVACDQVLYHLNERFVEARVLPFCKRHRIAVVAYSPFGSGDFPAPSGAGGRVLADIARRHGATPRQVALAFLTRNPAAFAIPKASDAAHVEENAGAAALRLSDEDLRRVDEAFPVGRTEGELPVL